MTTNDTTNLQELLDAVIETATALFAQRGQVHDIAPMLHIQRQAADGGSESIIAALEFPGESHERNALMQRLGNFYGVRPVTAAALISEGWRVNTTPGAAAPAMPLSRHPDRQEVLTITVMNRAGAQLGASIPILRSQGLRSLGQPDQSTRAASYLLEAFFAGAIARWLQMN